VDFDTSDVPTLILAEQERQRYLMDEFNNGLISGNEYRDGTGRNKVESELMDAMLANPNLTPIGNTEKPFEPQEQQPVEMAGVPPVDDAPTPEGEPGDQAEATVGEGGPEVPAEPTPEQEAALAGPLQFKDLEDKDEPDIWDVKSEESLERWTEILDRSLERFFERQQRVVMEKASGAKARRALTNGDLSVGAIFDVPTWDRQLEEDIAPVVNAIVEDASEIAMATSEKSDLLAGLGVDAAVVKQYVGEQIARLRQANLTTRREVANALVVVLALQPEEDRAGVLRTTLGAVFADLLGRRRRQMAEHEAQTAFNAGTYFAAEQVAGRRGVRKRWLSRRDGRVRSTHQTLHGQTRPVGQAFKVEGGALRFPGDPVAPPSLTMNCRCRLRFI